MAEVVVMPRLGNTVESCLITAWRVDVGDTLAPQTPICDVETDQAVALTVPARTSGIVVARLAEAGAEVRVREPILVVGQGEEDTRHLLATLGLEPPDLPQWATPPEPEEKEPEPPPAAEPEPVASPGEAAASALSRRVAAIFGLPEEPRVPQNDPAPVYPVPAWATTPPEPPPDPVAADEAPTPTFAGPKAASPRARELASVYGISVDTLTGSGPRGRIIERDVLAAVSGHARLSAGVSETPSETDAPPGRAFPEPAPEPGAAPGQGPALELGPAPEQGSLPELGPAPEQKPVPELGPAAGQEPALEAGSAGGQEPALEAGPAGGQEPAPEPGSAGGQEPAPGAASEQEPEPGAAIEQETEAGSAAEQKPASEAGSAAGQEPGVEPGAAPDKEPGVEPESASEREPALEAGPPSSADSMVESATASPTTTSGPGPGADPDASPEATSPAPFRLILWGPHADIAALHAHLKGDPSTGLAASAGVGLALTVEAQDLRPGDAARCLKEIASFLDGRTWAGED